jgi:hypothetical protein
MQEHPLPKMNYMSSTSKAVSKDTLSVCSSDTLTTIGSQLSSTTSNRIKTNRVVSSIKNETPNETPIPTFVSRLYQLIQQKSIEVFKFKKETRGGKDCGKKRSC